MTKNKCENCPLAGGACGMHCAGKPFVRCENNADTPAPAQNAMKGKGVG